MSAANCKPPRSDRIHTVGSNSSNDARPAHVVADKGRGAVVAGHLQPFAALAGVGLTLDTLLLEDMVIAHRRRRCATTDRGLRNLRATAAPSRPTALRSNPHQNKPTSHLGVQRNMESGRLPLFARCQAAASNRSGWARRSWRKHHAPPAPIHLDVTRACIRICEEHPEQTSRFLIAEVGGRSAPRCRKHIARTRVAPFSRPLRPPAARGVLFRKPSHPLFGEATMSQPTRILKPETPSEDLPREVLDLVAASSATPPRATGADRAPAQPRGGRHQAASPHPLPGAGRLGPVAAGHEVPGLRPGSHPPRA